MKNLFSVLALAVLLCGSAHTVSVVTMQVTIGASATQVTAQSIYAQQVFFQDNATHTMRIGDKNVSATRGALLASGSPGGSMTLSVASSNKSLDLADFWVAGTANDVLDVIYTQ